MKKKTSIAKSKPRKKDPLLDRDWRQATPASAPRDFKGLKALGAFQLRVLAELLGAQATREETATYMSMGFNDRVLFTFHLLAQWDLRQPLMARLAAARADHRGVPRR